MKLFDVMRKDIAQQVAKGNYKQAAKNAANLSTIFVLANSNVDAAKDFVLNKESTLPETVLDNYLKLLGMNKFMVDKAGRDGLGEALMGTIAPPTIVGNALLDPREALKMVPLGGKLIEGQME